jgi:hypothetical protein
MSAIPAGIYATAGRKSNAITRDRYLARSKTMGGREYA